MTTKKTTKLSEVGSTKGRAEKLTSQAKELVAKVNKTIKAAADYRQESDFTQSDFTVEVFRMTPILARQVLKHCNVSYGRSHGKGASARGNPLETASGNIKFTKGYCTNRTRDERIISRIKNEVLKDWFFEASNIAFNTKGMLIDGQHTLSAIVEADKAVDVILKTGCRIGSVQKIDVSRIRTIGQRLKFSGALPMEEPDTKTNYRVNIAGLILRSRVNNLGNKMKAGQLCDRGLGYYNDKAILNSHDKHSEGIAWLYANKTRNPAFRQSALIAAIAIFFNKDKEKAKKFYNNLISSNYIGKKSKGQNSVRKLHKMVMDINNWIKTDQRDKLPASYFGKNGAMNFWFKNTRRCIMAFEANRTFRPIK
tara:strand:+ start:1520 stop:2620 length:1101 start_codon:yes stop_codon:yes gene_type:complete